jgi:hypothetical protein
VVGFKTGDFGNILDVLPRLATGGSDLTPGFDIPFIPGMARGGSVKGNAPYIVGEKGPELFMPHTAGAIVPNHRLGGGGGINVTVNMPAGSNGEDVVRAIQKYARRNGTLAIPTTSLVR